MFGKMKMQVRNVKEAEASAQSQGSTQGRSFVFGPRTRNMNKGYSVSLSPTALCIHQHLFCACDFINGGRHCQSTTKRIKHVFSKYFPFPFQHLRQETLLICSVSSLLPSRVLIGHDVFWVIIHTKLSQMPPL